jgi:hypothetical protein
MKAPLVVSLDEAVNQPNRNRALSRGALLDEAWRTETPRQAVGKIEIDLC